VAHPTVVGGAINATTLALWARTPGATQNAYPTTETTSHLSFEATTLGAGTAGSVAGVATTAATLTIGTRVYTVVNELSETGGATAVVDQILYGGNETTMLDNLKVAINAGATVGTNYSTGTVVNAQVTATTNGDTTQIIQAITGGTDGNSIAVSETMANTTWGVGVTTLSGGVEREPKTLFVGTGGNVTVTTAKKTAGVVFKNLANGSTLPVLILDVTAATATDLILLN